MSTTKSNIQSMLASVREEKAQVKKRLEKLDERERTLMEWEKEEQLTAQPDLPEISTGLNGGSPLSAFLRGVLGDGRPHPLGELVMLVKGKGDLLEEKKSPGRVLHWALVGLQQHGYVKRNPDGTWMSKR